MVLESRITDVERLQNVDQIQNVADIETVAQLEAIVESVDANHYPSGGAVVEDGTTYPVTIDPTETIKELGFQIVAAEIEVSITTTGGSTFTFPVASETAFDTWDVDSVELTDPKNNESRTVVWWSGE